VSCSPARPKRAQRARGFGALGPTASSPADNVERLGRLTAQVGESSERIYLNFDKDWRKDFTVLIERKDGEAFKAAGIDPKALAGKKLRVCAGGSSGGTGR
jgi:hypothetical protein